mmetsp:Transcript_4138/g.4548  ORF Transcript_4138/g.4548 Transcript_4138/m.4548 type:complete len:416 (-) Transcript_4138:105-1352(-)
MRLALVLVLCLCTVAYCSDNGLGATPPMGWNTWCTMGSCYQHGGSSKLHDVCYESEIKSVATAMLNNGMHELGYEYINLDDCWANTKRDANGDIMADPKRFPKGIAELVSWLHERGLKFGLYTSAGFTTCSSGGRPEPIPGSYGHYESDAATFAKWDVDYVKLDWCDTRFPNGTEMSQQVQTDQFYNAMNKTKKAMWLNFHCGHPPQDWCKRDGNSFRIGPDHHDYWPNTMSEIQALIGLGKHAGPGHWNDPDFLMTGGSGCGEEVPGLHCPGMTDEEYKTVFTIWSIVNAPLLVSTDIRNMTNVMKEALLNKALIAVNQDTYQAGDLITTWHCNAPMGTCQIWGKYMSDDSYVAALFNSGSGKHSITLDFSLFDKAGQTLRVTDLWKNTVSTHTGSYVSAEIPSHGVVAIRLSA